MLTTLHTNDAASAVARLKDMGVDTGLLATSVNCIVAQRLARRLCLHCREGYEPSDDELREAGFDEDVGRPTLYRAKGCLQCSGTGYHGRVAVYEILAMQGRIRALMEASTDELFSAAVDQGMTSMRRDGLRLCLAGTSSLEELDRVIG